MFPVEAGSRRLPEEVGALCEGAASSGLPFCDRQGGCGMVAFAGKATLLPLINAATN